MRVVREGQRKNRKASGVKKVKIWKKNIQAGLAWGGQKREVFLKKVLIKGGRSTL